MNISLTKKIITDNAHIVGGVIAALVVPGEFGTKLIVGSIVAGAIKAVMIGRSAATNDVAVEDTVGEHNQNALSCGLMLVAGGLMILPTVVNPVVSIAVKVTMFTLIRRGLYDFAMTTYGKSPFDRHSFHIKATAKEGALLPSFEFAI